MAKVITRKDSNHCGADKELQTVLRKATLSDHHAIDHHPLLAHLVRPELTMHRYGQILMSFYWINRPLQERLVQGVKDFWGEQDFKVSDRISWLENDLEFFGSLFIAKNNNPLNHWTLPPITSTAQLIGEIYVLEGATLGGQVIARALESNLGLTPTTGCQFFHGHGVDTLERWRSFLAKAENSLLEADFIECSLFARNLFEKINFAMSLVHCYWNDIGQRGD